jgi:hypothetical protein
MLHDGLPPASLMAMTAKEQPSIDGSLAGLRNFPVNQTKTAPAGASAQGVRPLTIVRFMPFQVGKVQVWELS